MTITTSKAIYFGLLSLLIVSVVTFVNTPKALALSCAVLPESAFDRGDVIFAGTVTSITPSPDETDDDFGLRRGGTATFDVTQYWKGGTSTSVTVHNIYAWGVSGTYFKTGSKYIVFADKVVNGSSTVLSANIDCGSTAQFSDELVAELSKNTADRVPSTPLPTQAFSRNLTVGISGSDVVQLQQFLEQKGFLTMPPGVAKGYFGTITRAALAKYQAARQISPAVGYFGPLTRERVSTEMIGREAVQ